MHASMGARGKGLHRRLERLEGDTRIKREGRKQASRRGPHG